MHADPGLQNHSSSVDEANQEKEDLGLQGQRSEWFYSQRAYPQQHVPVKAHLNAVSQLRRKLAVEAAARSSSLAPLSAPSWTGIGPRPSDTPYTDPVVSGRVSTLAVHPSNSNIAYLGAAQGGVWKTIDGGTTWTPLTDTQASLAVGSIALDPSNPNTIYVGTGEENFAQDSYYGVGILKSIDGGSTWTQICGPFCGPIGADSYYGGGAHIGGIAVQPGNSSVLLAAVQLSGANGIYRSADGGNTWLEVLSGNPGTSVLFDPSNGGVAYAALGNSSSGGTEGVYKSADGGQTWTPINGTGSNVLSLANAGRIVLALAPSATRTLYAGIANVNSGSLLGFFETTDGGNNWNQLSTPDYCTPQCWYDNVIAVQPNNPQVVYAGGAYGTTLIRSLDGGASWSILQSAENGGFLHADMHALAFTADGTKLYLGNDGGAYSTVQPSAGAPTFTALNSTLSTIQFYPGISVNPTNPAVAFGGTQDNGTQQYSGSLTWNQVNCGDGAYTAIDPASPGNVYSACNGISLWKSAASGGFGSWRSAQSGINTGDRSDFIPPLVIDPSTTSNLYFGTYRIYQTTNGASSWTAISPDLTSGNSYWGVITTIAVAPNSSNTVYAGTGDSHVQVTTNAGSGALATWTDRSAGLPPRVITHLAVDPTASTTAYVTFSGFSGFSDTLGHIFKSTNGGANWVDISGNLPNTPANDLVIVPNVTGMLFVATDVGVFYTVNAGAGWTSVVNGLPRVAVLGLALHNASQTLRAATHGRGMWDLNIATLLPPPSITSLSPASAIVGSSSFTLTVNGTNFDSTSTVRWNGSNLVTSFVNTTQLTATVPTNDLTTLGNVQVTVFSSSTGQLSAPAIFSVNASVATYTISGQVTISGQGLTGVSLALLGGGTATTSPSGNYSFAPVVGGATYTVTPSLTGFQFSPPSQTFANLSANQTANFTASSVSGPLGFITVIPCRVLDTRNPNGTFGGPFMTAGSVRSFPIPSGACGVPSSALAYSVNVTVVPKNKLEYLTLWPTGQSQPTVSTLNSLDGRIVANAAIVPSGTNGAVSAFVTDQTDVIMDINGYFAAPGSSAQQLTFVPVTPCRVADTRNANGAFGGPSLGAGSTRTFSIPSSSCNIPPSTAAYSLNATVVPHTTLQYLTLWPAGQSQPVVSTLNSYNGQVVANAAIVPAGTDGAVSAFVTDQTDLVLDINGYFTTSPPTPVVFTAITPCRVADTRNPAGTFGGPAMSSGSTRDFPVPASSCGIPSNASAYSLNVTVVPATTLGYLTLWPLGQSQPYVSTLNSPNGQIVANAAIVPAGTNGAVSVFVTDQTDVILDIDGYFVP